MRRGFIIPALVIGLAGPPAAAAQDPIYTRRTGPPPDSLWRMRLDPAACGAPIPLVRATPSGQVRDTVFPVEMLDRLPDLMRVDPPSYPAVMTRTGFDAFVVLSVLVEANGQPSRVMVARTSRHRGVDSAIRESMLMTVRSERIAPSFSRRLGWSVAKYYAAAFLPLRRLVAIAVDLEQIPLCSCFEVIPRIERRILVR
ncbi:MAG: hypothetical protein AABY85_10095 [Gemmatimonadota bacterium]